MLAKNSRGKAVDERGSQNNDPPLGVFYWPHGTSRIFPIEYDNIFQPFVFYEIRFLFRVTRRCNLDAVARTEPSSVEIFSEVLTNGNNIENESTLVTLPPLPKFDVAPDLDNSSSIRQLPTDASTAPQHCPFQPLHVYCDPVWQLIIFSFKWSQIFINFNFQDAWGSSDSSESPWEIRNMAGLDKMLPKNYKTPLCE